MSPKVSVDTGTDLAHSAGSWAHLLHPAASCLSRTGDEGRVRLYRIRDPWVVVRTGILCCRRHSVLEASCVRRVTQEVHLWRFL